MCVCDSVYDIYNTEINDGKMITIHTNSTHYAHLIIVKYSKPNEIAVISLIIYNQE